jgi:hypothetical protein
VKLFNIHVTKHIWAILRITQRIRSKGDSGMVLSEDMDGGSIFTRRVWNVTILFPAVFLNHGSRLLARQCSIPIVPLRFHRGAFFAFTGPGTR